MTPSTRFIPLSLVALALTAAGPALADHHAVRIAQKEGVGSYLTDAKGMALYQFQKDAPGTSACEGGCLEKWPIFFREAVEAKGDLKAADFGTITRADGKRQTTYKGLPLYYFAADKAPGDTAGQGVKGVWKVAAP